MKKSLIFLSINFLSLSLFSCSKLNDDCEEKPNYVHKENILDKVYSTGVKLTSEVNKIRTYTFTFSDEHTVDFNVNMNDLQITDGTTNFHFAFFLYEDYVVDLIPVKHNKKLDKKPYHYDYYGVYFDGWFKNGKRVKVSSMKFTKDTVFSSNYEYYPVKENNYYLAYPENTTQEIQECVNEFNETIKTNNYTSGIFPTKDDNASHINVRDSLKKGYSDFFINTRLNDETSRFVSYTNQPGIFFGNEPKLDNLKIHKNTYFVGTGYGEAGKIQGKLAANIINSHDFSSFDNNKDGKIGLLIYGAERGQAIEDNDILNCGKYLERNLNGGNKNAEFTIQEGATNIWNKVKIISTAFANHNQQTDPSNNLRYIINEDKNNEIDVIFTTRNYLAYNAVDSKLLENKNIHIFGKGGEEKANEYIENEDKAYLGTVKFDSKKVMDTCFKVSNAIKAEENLEEIENVTTSNDVFESDANKILFDKENHAFYLHYLPITSVK